MNHLKTVIPQLLKNKEIFDKLFFSDSYETSARLPLKVEHINNYRESDKSNYLLLSSKIGASGAVGYASYKKMYFDASFATILEVGSELGNKIPTWHFSKMLIDIDNELLHYLAMEMTTNYKTINNENFVFSNIVPDDDEKTASNFPFHCNDFDLYDSSLPFHNVLSAINCTRLFSFISKVTDVDSEHMKFLSDMFNSNEEIDFHNARYFDLIMSIDDINDILEAYIKTFQKFQSMTVHT